MDNIKILKKEIETLTNKKNKTGNPAEKQIITDRIIELKKEISSLRKQIPTKIVPVINAPIVAERKNVRRSSYTNNRTFL